MNLKPDIDELLKQLRVASKLRTQEDIHLHLSQRDCGLIADKIEGLQMALRTIASGSREGRMIVSGDMMEIAARALVGHHQQQEPEKSNG